MTVVNLSRIGLPNGQWIKIDSRHTYAHFIFPYLSSEITACFMKLNDRKFSDANKIDSMCPECLNNGMLLLKGFMETYQINKEIDIRIK